MKKLILVFVLCASAHADAQDFKIGPAPYAVLIGGQAADAWTTWNFLTDGSGVESNRVIGQSPQKMLVFKLVATSLNFGIMKFLDARASKKRSRALVWTGRIIGYASGGMGAWAGAHNQFGIASPPCAVCGR